MFNLKYIKKYSGILTAVFLLLAITVNPSFLVSLNIKPIRTSEKENNIQDLILHNDISSPSYENSLLEFNDLKETNEMETTYNISQNHKKYDDQSSSREIEITKEDEQGLIISFALPDIIIDNVEDASRNKYQKISISNGGHLAEIGKPELPTKGVYLDVPNSVDLDVEVIKSSYYEEYGYNIYPSQGMVPDYDTNETNFEKNTTFYEENKFFPNNIVELKDVGIIRDHRTALLIIYPVIYNPATKIIRIYNELEIEVNYKIKDVKDYVSDQKMSEMSRYYSNEFSSFFESIYLNYDSLSNEEMFETAQIEAVGADYLIITPDVFYDEIIPLAQHKSNKGLLTEIVNLSSIGTNPSADDISEYIQNAYDSWNPAPTYLLLVGDSNLLPPHYKTYHPYDGALTATDLYYATVDGEDYFPDIFVGRLPVKNEAELNTVVNKIIDYEQNFNQNDPWRKNVTLAAYDQYGRYFIDTCENISSFLETKDYDITKIYTGGSYSGTTQDVIDAINSGTFLVNHRDHGEWYGWGDPSFTVDEIDELNNGDMLPVMFSINCLSGRFDYSYEDCFAEAILKAENKGVVACIASTRVSYSGYNDELDKGFIASIWPDYQSSYDNYVGKSAKLGHILNFGKMYMYDKYVLTGGTGYPWGPDPEATLITYEMFTLFGDPELTMFQVDHDLEVSLEIPNNPNISKTYVVNATVFNVGLEDLSDINLYLYFDEQIVEDIYIPILSVGDNVSINYSWTPQNYGKYNFTAYVPPKLEEFYLNNNRVTKIAQIKRDLIVNLEVPLKIYVNESYLINATITNDGVNQENDIDFYLKINNDIKNHTCIPTLNIEESYIISYNWTPNAYGVYNITCDTPFRQDEFNIINNVYQENKTINPIVFKDGFENGRSNWKNVDGLWHFTSIKSPWLNPCYSDSHAMWFGKESTGNFQTGRTERGSFISNPINLSDVTSAYLNFYQWKEVEQLYPYDCGYLYISIDCINWVQLYRNGMNIEPWEYINFNISKYCGNDTIYIKFYFDTLDSLYNYYRGWLIDDVEIYTLDYDYKAKKIEYIPKQPSLTDEDVIPSTGYQDTLITFRANYTDSDNNAPLKINAIINGTTYGMIKEDNLDYDYTDGCIYMYSNYLTPNIYNYIYYFNCTDGVYAYTTSIYNDLRIHYRPTLTNESVTPKIGYVDTIITFKVNYTDLDNMTPLQICVVISGYAYSMSKQDSLDIDYTDGCIYLFSTSFSPRSYNYSYYIYCSDDGVNSVRTSSYSDLKIHSKPVLTNVYLGRSTGYPDTLFTFRVTYYDADNDAPTQINLIINNTPYVMAKLYYDYYYADGCIYTYSTYLPIDPYNYIYYFNCSDGVHFINTSIYNNLRVHNKPTLIIESVSPKQGYENTLITFRVNYTDLDNDTPSQISVMIDWISYSMLKLDSLDNDYSDSCIYGISIYLSASSYNYTYWFQYSDDGVNFFSTEFFYDLNIVQIPTIDDDNGNNHKDKGNKSDGGYDSLLSIIIGISSISAIASFATVLFIKKRNIKLFKNREKGIL